LVEQKAANVAQFSESVRLGRQAAVFVKVMDTILETKNLRVEYRSRELKQAAKLALKGLNLRVNAGEVFGFLGPNGAGKTTTMNVLLGYVNPTEGEAFLFDVNVREPIARQRIGYLPELTYYYKFLTAEELLRFYARIFGIPKAETEKRIDQLLKLVELDHARKRPIRTYSKGMQQRAGLAQALINNPDLLLLDEPTSGLDPLGRMKVREIIQRLKNEGKTVFFSSHELGEVETVCDRVAILHQGELKIEGRVSDLVSQYQCNLEQIFLKVVGYQPQA
jgi:ABC-2 type transport system ATP-binding protein